jgi:hypothetical protein
MNRCLFCGGDYHTPEHMKYCDGRQGRVEAAIENLPRLISGLEPDTWDTSEAAAVSVEDAKATQRAAVYAAIKAAGGYGCTDDEIQQRLNIDGSSERPRRWELWKLDQIAMRRDDWGDVVKRETRTHRRAVVWIAR